MLVEILDIKFNHGRRTVAMIHTIRKTTDMIGDTRINFRIPHQDMQRLKALAQKKGWQFSDMIRYALNQFEEMHRHSEDPQTKFGFR